MTKLNHRTRRSSLKKQANRTVTLTVETLEPRLVLSAAGFGFESAGERLGHHVRDHGNRQAEHAAFAGQIQGNGGNQQFALPAPRMDRHGPNSNHFESRPPQPGSAGQPRGGQRAEPFGAIPCEFVPCGPRMHHQPGKRLDDTARAEGESPLSTDNRDDLIAPTLDMQTTIPTTVVTFISLPPASSPTHGDELRNVGQPAPRLAQPPRTSTIDLVSRPSSSTPTLPVTAAVSRPSSTRVSATTTVVESPVIRFEFGSTNSQALPRQQVSESRNIVTPDFATFVSLSQSDSASGWDSELDVRSFDAAIGSFNQLSNSVTATMANERPSISSMDSLRERLAGLSEASLWAALSDGGFIEIETDAADDSHERFDSAEESENAPASKRLSAATPRDAFWFDFGDTRLDSIFDSLAVEELAAEQTLKESDGADEEAWLLDDGGMIVLTSSQFIDRAVEVASDDASGSSASGETVAGETVAGETVAGETDIPMDAGIGVFQAIEVATTVVEQQDGLEADEGATEPLEGEATAHADDAVPAAGQAAKNSESDESDPIRATSMPLLLAIATFLFGGHERRKKIADQRRKV